MNKSIWCDNLVDLVVLNEGDSVIVELIDINIGAIQAELTLSQAETLQLMLGDAIEELKQKQ